MTNPDVNPSLVDVCRQLVSAEEQMCDSVNDDTHTKAISSLEDNSDMTEGHFASLSEYSRDEVTTSSRSRAHMFNEYRKTQQESSFARTF